MAAAWGSAPRATASSSTRSMALPSMLLVMGYLLGGANRAGAAHEEHHGAVSAARALLPRCVTSPAGSGWRTGRLRAGEAPASSGRLRQRLLQRLGEERDERLELDVGRGAHLLVGAVQRPGGEPGLAVDE